MSDTPSCAVVFCAGFGTRMRHLVQDVPKPMVPYHGKPMVDHTVDLIRSAGLHKVYANTHHHADRIEPHLADLGVEWNREEGDILDTGGGLKALAPHLPAGPVLTMNPDAAWQGPNPVTTLLEAWRPGMSCLLLLTPIERTDRTPPGDFALDKGQTSRKGNFVYTGAQIIRPELVTAIDEDVFSLNKAWDMAIGRTGVDAVVYAGKWQDIGTPEGLATVETSGGHVQA